MKFYDIDSIFTFGKYEGKTLAEVFEVDPKYIKYCQDNIDEFYIAPNVLKELKTVERDNRLLSANLDEMSDDELADFMDTMNDIDDFDEAKFEDDFDWDKEEDMLMDDDFEDEYYDEDDFVDDSYNDYDDNFDGY